LIHLVLNFVTLREHTLKVSTVRNVPVLQIELSYTSCVRECVAEVSDFFYIPIF
jgi:hypothetical protein